MFLTKHDKSGQVYSEVIHPHRPIPSLPFTHKSLGQPPLLRADGVGAGKLQEMCVRRFLNSLECLEKESLEGVPERVLEGLWRGVGVSGLESIRIWQIFTQAHPRTPPLHHKAFVKDPVQNAPLSNLPAQLDSPNLHWLTTLTLSNTSVPPDSMLHLANITNLVSLHITSNDTRTGQSLDDDVFRRWSRQASTSAGFPRLQILFLRFQHGITSHAFDFIDGFPKLRMFCTSRCRISIREVKKTIRDKGWKMSKHEFYAYMKSALEDSASLGFGRPWLPQVDWYTMIQARALGGEKPDTPLLSVQLGSHNGAKEAGMIYVAKEVECYVKDPEAGRIEVKRKVEEGEEEENDPKRRKIRDRKKVELLDMLQGM